MGQSQPTAHLTAVGAEHASTAFVPVLVTLHRNVYEEKGQCDDEFSQKHRITEVGWYLSRSSGSPAHCSKKGQFQ